MMRTVIACTAFALLTGAALAHHGWGSYDAAKPVTVAGPILTSKFENPHMDRDACAHLAHDQSRCDTKGHRGRQ
jgi:hypothetical protein